MLTFLYVLRLQEITIKPSVCVCANERKKKIAVALRLFHKMVSGCSRLLNLLSSRSFWYFSKLLKGSKLLKYQFFIQNAILVFVVIFFPSVPCHGNRCCVKTFTHRLFSPQRQCFFALLMLQASHYFIILLFVAAPINLQDTEELVSLVLISGTSLMTFLEERYSMYCCHIIR